MVMFQQELYNTAYQEMTRLPWGSCQHSTVVVIAYEVYIGSSADVAAAKPAAFV